MAISSAIASQLKTIQNADGAYWFDDDTVREEPVFNFAGYPAAIVVPSNVESEYQTVLDNTRQYAFIIVLVEQAQELKMSEAYSNMRQLEDDVLDLFDRDYSLGGLQSSLGAGYQLIDTNAAPSAWERISVETLELLTAVIRLNVMISVDLD